MSVDATSTLVFQFYLKQIQNLYRQHSLSNIQNVESLLKQFPGKEYLVYIQICKKCGVEPEKQRTLDELAAENPLPPIDRKVSIWLTNKGYKSYAETPQFMAMKWENFMAISTGEQLRVQGVHPQHVQTLLILITSEAGLKEGPKPVASIISEPPAESSPAPKSDFKIGDNCFTKVIKSGEKNDEEGWLKAKVMRVNKNNTFDIFVHNARGYGVPPEAVNVPRSFLKKSVENVKVSPPSSNKRPHPDSTKFSQGDRVWVHGLRSHRSYNGLGGTIAIFRERRYQVELDNGEFFAIRPENLFSWEVEVPKETVDAGMKKLKSAGFASQEDGDVLHDLITRLMRYDTSRSTDHVKLGEFAAGYFIAQRRVQNNDMN